MAKDTESINTSSVKLPDWNVVGLGGGGLALSKADLSDDVIARFAEDAQSKEGGLVMSDTPDECRHEHTHDEIRAMSQCRYIPSTWERESDDDPFETVTIHDRLVFCDDCGELVDYSPGD